MKILLGFAFTVTYLAAQQKAMPAKASELYDPAKIWSLHLTVTAEQWQAMEPKGGPQGFGGPGPGGRPGGGGPGGFGPAMLLAPAFLKGDRDGDGRLSREEFSALGDEWFAAWDKPKQSKLSDEQFRAGINSTFQPPMMGGPGGPGGGGPPMMFGNPNGGMQGANGRNGVAAMMGIDFEYVHADLDFNGVTYKDVALRYKGNGTYLQSRGALKRSMKVDLDKYVKGQALAGLDTLNLHSNVTDAAWMNESLSYRLFREGKVPAPRTGWARVYVTVSGKHERQYLGLYSLVEEVDESFFGERLSTRAGAIFKPSTRSLFAYLGDDWSKYKQLYDPKTELDAKQKQRVYDFSKLVTSGKDENFSAQVGAFVDMDEFARYLAINVWLANVDSILSMGQNFYLYLNPANDKFSILPWDLDLAFGGLGGSAELSVAHPWRDPNRFLERLFKVESFHKAYLAHMTEFNKTIFQPERLAKLVDEAAAVIRPAVQDESAAKLANFDKSVAGERPTAQGFGGGGFGGPGGPGGGQGSTPVKAFAGLRAKSVTAQLAGESKGQLQGGGFGGGPGMGGGPGGPGGPGGGGRGGFGLANFLAPPFIDAMDGDRDKTVTQAEFRGAFARWFDAWSGGGKGLLSGDQLRDGINRDLVPQRPPDR